MTHELLDLSVEELEAQEAVELPERELMEPTCNALINIASCLTLTITLTIGGGTGTGAAGGSPLGVLSGIR